MRVTMLGSGHAGVTECYNTCFVFEDEKQYFLVDGGGGNGLLTQLKHAEIPWDQIHHIFVTHRHLDHITGVFWMMRVILQSMAHGKYEQPVYIYGHDEVIDILAKNAEMLFCNQLQYINTQLHLIPVNDGETRNIINHDVTFFDIHSSKAKQFGFRMKIEEGKDLVCFGDEPYNDSCRSYAQGCMYMMHEAFCLEADEALYHPHKISHSTVKDACEHASDLNIPNLILYHTEDENLKLRKELYGEEGRRYYSGSLLIPDDLETIEL